MKKKALALFLAALLVASAVGCGSSQKNEEQTTPDTENNGSTQGGEQNGSTGENGGDSGSIVDPNGGTSGSQTQKPNDKAGITLSSGTNCTLKIGQTHQIVAAFVPEYDKDSTKLIFASADAGIASVTESGLVSAIAKGSTKITVKNESGKFTATVTVTVTEDDLPPVGNDPIPDRTQYLTVFESTVYSGNLILANLQNKLHFLEADNLLSIKKDGGSSHLLVSVFKHQLGSEALSALAKLAEDFHTALSENSDKTVKDLLVTDAYHTSDEQQALFDQKLDAAPAGYSDFQTGLSVSLKFFDGTFTYTIGNHQAETETAWLMQNYAKYGFILRYPEGKKDQTGYDANNAHFRYVGVPHAQYITENNLTLEEYIELLKGYTMEKPLQIVTNGEKYSVYYTASQGTESTVAVPGFTTAVDYSISGNNVDGFIVTVKAHWAEDAFDATLPTPNPDAGITLDRTEATLTVDDTLQLGATFIPLYDGDDTALIFQSSDKAIATVDQNGKITAISKGSVTITVTNKEGDFSATCTVTVNAKAPTPNPDAGITLSENELSLKTGDTHQLIATFIPEFDTDNTMLIYSVSGSAVTVSGTGSIYAKAIGTAVITVKSLDGKYSAKCSVTVTKGINFDASLILDKSEITLEEGSSTQLLSTFIPKYDTDSTVLYYESSNNSIATVDADGMITAVKEGTAIITVKNENGEFSATCTVTVTYKPPVADPDAGITLDKTQLTLNVNDSYTLGVTFKTEFPDDSTMISFSTSSSSVVSVNGKGTITALKPGVATVTVKSLDGKFRAQCIVYVLDPNAHLTLEKSELTLNEGQTTVLKADYLPSHPTDDGTLIYESSDDSIVLVDQNGMLTAKKHGTAVITVKNEDGSFTKSCTVTVLEVADPNAGITLDKNEITLEQDQTDKIAASFIPAFDADDTVLTFESSDDTTVSVDSEGNLTAHKPGKVTITVKNADGSFRAECVVTVTEKANENAGITLDKNELTLTEGEDAKLSATFVPLYPSDDTTLTFQSENQTIVSVDAQGNLTAHKPGKVTITVKNADGSFRAECVVTVTEKANDNAGITLEQDALTVRKGDEGKINATFIPLYSSDSTKLFYESSDNTTVSVDENGNFTALKTGNATITVKNADGSFSAECVVTVLDGENPNAGITLEQNEITLVAGSNGKINATFIPAFETDDTSLNFVSYNESIVKVDENGNLIALMAGTTEVVVANGGGKYVAICTVTVTPKPNENPGITLNGEVFTAVVGESVRIKATFIPLYQGDSTELTYTVEHSNIATVDANGLILGISAGQTTVTVTNYDSSYSVSCTVIITEPIPVNPDAGITLEKNNFTLHLTSSPSAAIVATVIPEYETDGTAITYESSDASIVSVDENGILHAHKVGTVTITLRSGNLTATCKVTATNLLIGEDEGGNYGEFVPYQ